MAQLTQGMDVDAMARQMFQLFDALTTHIVEWSMASPIHMIGAFSVVFLLFYALAISGNDMLLVRCERREYPCARHDAQHPFDND